MRSVGREVKDGSKVYMLPSKHPFFLLNHLLLLSCNDVHEDQIHIWYDPGGLIHSQKELSVLLRQNDCVLLSSRLLLF